MGLFDFASAAGRLAGYSWDDINDHVDQATNTALAAGYTQPEIDAHLGYGDPSALAGAIQGILPEEPPTVGKEPAPLDQRVSELYATGMRDGQLKGPRDFASMYADAFGDALGDNRPLFEEQLASQLPHPEDVTDHGIAIAHGFGAGDLLQNSLQAGSNLYDLFGQMGMTPQEVLADPDPVLQDALVTPPSPGEPTLREAATWAEEQAKINGGEDQDPSAMAQATVAIAKGIFNALRPPTPSEALEEVHARQAKRKELQDKLGGFSTPLNDLLNSTAIGMAEEYGTFLVNGVEKPISAAALEGLKALQAGLEAIEASAKKGQASFFELMKDTQGSVPRGPTEGEKIIDLSGMGKGMMDNFYGDLFKGLQGEENAVSKMETKAMAQLRPEFEAGNINSAEDVKNFFNKSSEAVVPTPEERNAAVSASAQETVDSLGTARAERPIEPPLPEGLAEPPPPHEPPPAAAGEMPLEEQAAHTSDKIGRLKDRLDASTDEFEKNNIRGAIAREEANLDRLEDRIKQAGEPPRPTEVAQAAHDLFEEHYFGNHPIEDALYRLTGNASADRDHFFKLLETISREHPEWVKDSFGAQVRDSVEQRLINPNHAHTPEVQEYLDAIKSLTDRQFANAARLRELTANTPLEELFTHLKTTDEGYVRRMAKGEEMRASAFDPETSQDAITGANIGGRSLFTKTGSMEGRSYYVLEKDGQREFGDTSLSNLINPNTGKPFRYGEKTADGWEVKQPTTREIEAGTKGTPNEIEFHSNHLALTIENILQQERTIRNLEFLGKLKPELMKTGQFVPVTEANRYNGPSGFVRTEVPQLDGWMHPLVGYPVNDFFKNGMSDLEGAIGKIGRTILSSLFITPFAHWNNVAWHWFKSRGLEWVNPVGYGRLISTTAQAIHEVWTRGPLYQEFRRNGGALLYQDTALANYWNLMQSKFVHDINADKGGLWTQFARAVLHPIATAQDLGKAVYAFSRRSLWAGGDVMMMQRYLELTRPKFNIKTGRFDKPGLSTREAIYQAERDIPNYRIPAQLGRAILSEQGAHALGQALRSPITANFNRYHYGMMRDLATNTRDVISPNATLKERVEGVGKFLAMAGGMYMLWPAMNQVLQTVTGSKAEFRLGGTPGLVKAGMDFASDHNWLSFSGKIFGLSPMVSIAAGISSGRDIYGRPILNANTPLGQVMKGLEWGADQIPLLNLIHKTIEKGPSYLANQLAINPHTYDVSEERKASFAKRAAAEAATAERNDVLENWIREKFGGVLPDWFEGNVPPAGSGRVGGGGGSSAGGGSPRSNAPPGFVRRGAYYGPSFQGAGQPSRMVRVGRYYGPDFAGSDTSSAAAPTIGGFARATQPRTRTRSRRR